MSQLINKAIFKYILLLLLTFIISVSVVISVHFFFHSRTTDINAQSKNLAAKMEIARYLLEDIKSIHISFLELSASESNPYTRQKKIDTLRAQIQRCEHTLSLLQKGGTFTKQFSPTSSLNLHYTKDTSFSLEPSIQNDLSAIYNAIDAISKLLNQRDSYLSTNDKTLKGTSEIIRNFNNNLNYIFSLLIESIEKTTLEDHQKLAEFESKIKTEQHQNHLLEIFILCLTTFTILLVIYRILEQILNLYKTLEKQLYYDGHTGLKSRTALLKDLSLSKNPSIIILDINMFRTFNELYGVEVGNEVLKAFATFLRHFAKDKDFQVYRIAGDEFAFFKEIKHVNIEYFKELLEIFFKTITNKSIYIPSLDDVVYVDVTAGLSFDAKNPLGTADIALNRAKALHKNYVIYHSELDSIREIKQGALWKKKIIDGLMHERFIPFFQPIVDRNRNVVKYEALMRFVQQNGHKSFITPFEFLDIAVKTRHYDQISQMTLLKSLKICAEKDISVSLNLNYHDILNKPLHVLLKKFIFEHSLGSRVVFEIVESEHIQNYELLKHFMLEFRSIGVRFAIDDFGTGFSNFSHIFELSPDFIKIDGSLIKNIDTDKSSYELVKGIIFFSRELGIKTVAEYVHSEAIFQTALELGIDQFQGYYFGEPKEEITEAF
jgi:diguanylate cyclase (GGDEF)-like protein